MGTTVERTLDANEMAELIAQRDALTRAGGGSAAAGKFNFFAAFDGTRNDKNNVGLSGSAFQTNIANLYEQANSAALNNSNFRARYYKGVGTGDNDGGPVSAAISPTAPILATAEEAYANYRELALAYCVANPDATADDLTASIAGFSRGAATAIEFAKLLNDRGLVANDGTVLAPPGSIKVLGGMVLLDPVATFVDGNLSIPSNVIGTVLVVQALDEDRRLFRLSDYGDDPRVEAVWVSGNHCGIGGGYDQNGTSAAVLEGVTEYYQSQGTMLDEVPAERAFDASTPAAIYTEKYATARNGDVLTDRRGQPRLAWSVDEGRRRFVSMPLPSETHHPTDPHSVDAVNGFDAQSDAAQRTRESLERYLDGLDAARSGGGNAGLNADDLRTAEYYATQLHERGEIDAGLYNHFTEWASDQWLLSGQGAGQQGALSGVLPLDPIGAFYESRSSANDPAPSIARKTPVLMGATASTLQAHDQDGDGRLSGNELAGLSAWVDGNEDGLMDASERQTLDQVGIAQIADEDYSFYTRGNGRAASSPLEVPVKASESAGQPSRSFVFSPFKPFEFRNVPASGYRNLRDTDNVYAVAGGQINWGPDQVKVNSLRRNYLIGTDGDDSFDATYYARYPQYINSALLTHFLAGDGNDTMGGSARADRLWGGQGNDLLLGYAGDDTLYGEEGADELQGQDGADVLDGGSGDDTLLGGAGHDQLNGGDGVDGLNGQVGDDTLYGGLGGDELQGGDGNDKLLGEADDDRLFGQAGNDLLWGGDGDDVLMGFTASNESKQSLLAGETDDDKLFGEGGDDELHGGLGNDELDGGTGNDWLGGDAGQDTLFGGAGADEIHGGEGDDKLLGESGNDKLFGQVGNDTLWGGEGDDVMLGFTASNEAKQSLNPGETDNDTLHGGAGDDNLYGGVGDDTLDGGIGNDLIAGNEDNDRLFGGAGSDELLGGSGADHLAGEAGDDRLFGQGGNDVLWGGDGNDILLGFTGTNEAKQSLDTGETDDDVLYGGSGQDLILGGLGSDELHGDSDDDELQGGSGHDRLYGGHGADRLFGQVGDDLLYGGQGDDVLVGFTGANESQQALGAGESDNDWLYGGAGRDLLLGGLGNDYLDGGEGADSMEGGAGDDTYIVNSVNDSVLERAGEGRDTVITSVNYLLNHGIEELRLLEGLEIHGTGNALDNTLIGNSRSNILDGVTGADEMRGGGGDDTYYVDNVGDRTVELAGEGVDTVQSTISHHLAADVENLVLLDFSKPERGLVDGRAVLVYGYPKLNELDYMQGDAVPDYQGTCALTSIANLLTQADRPTSEAEVVAVAIDNRWAVTDPTRPAYERGGSNYADQQKILDSFGVRNDLLAGYDDTAVANLIRSGRGVIIAVNAGVLWNDSSYVGDGGVNHVVTVTGAAYSEEDGSLMGFYIADSGRRQVGDMTRYVSVDDFRSAAQQDGAYAIFTMEPLKLWDEAVSGWGNDLDNVLVGNRADNALYGQAGADTLDGGAGNDSLHGGTGSDTYLMSRGMGHDTIEDMDSSAQDTDVLKFGAGISADQLWFRRSSLDLEVSIIGTEDKVTIRNWFASESGSAANDAYLIEEFQLADGQVLLDSEVARLVDAMAVFDPRPMGQLTLPANYRVELAPVMAATWG